MLADRLLGNGSRLPFPLLLCLRSLLVQRSASTALALLALASSVGLAASVELTTRSLRQALRTATDEVVGSAELEVTAGDVGVSESLIETLRATPGVRSASPLIQRTFRVAGGRLAGHAVRVLAIDLLYEHEVRSFGVSRGGYSVRDPLRLFAAPNAILVSAGLAEKLGIQEGDPLELRASGSGYAFAVRGTLTGPLSEAFNGQVAVMDVYGLQSLLGSNGRVDRIELVLDPGVDREAVSAAIAARLDEGESLQVARAREIYAEPMLRTLNAAVWIVATIGVMVALLLVYALTSLTVDRRVREFALLRAAGMGARVVAWLIVVDALALALVGTAVGLLAAAWLSDPLVDVFSRASAYLQHTDIPRSQVRASTLWVGLAAGLPVALLASVGPARRASRRAPLDVLDEDRALPSPGRAGRRGALLGGASALVAAVAWAASGAIPNVERLVLVIGFGTVAVGAGLTQILLRAFRPLQRALGRAIPHVGYLACSSFLSRPGETGATLAVWSAVSAGLVSLLLMVNSFVTTIDDYWLGLYGPRVVMVFGQDPLSSQDRELISPETIAAIRATPGVIGLAECFNLGVRVRGEDVVLESLATQTLLARSQGARTLSDDPDASAAALLRGELVMSDAFASHFAMKPGDEITLATARGSHRFRIGGYARAYAGRTGSLFLDIDTFRRWFAPSGAAQVAIWTQEPHSDVFDAVQRRSSQALFFEHGAAFREHTAAVVAKFNDLLMIPVFLIGTIGVLALLNLLVGNVVSRGRELALLRAAGATRANLSALVLLNGTLVGLLGTASGVVLGIAWARVATDAVAEALGYYVEYRLDLPAIALIGLGGIVVSLLSSLLANALRETPAVVRASG